MFSRNTKRSRNVPIRSRLQVESLEDRVCLNSSFAPGALLQVPPKIASPPPRDVSMVEYMIIVA